MKAAGKGHNHRRATAPALIAAMAALGSLLAAGVAKPQDIALGEYLSAECVTCHQLSGQSTGAIPPIVGLPEDHFIEALLAYKNGERNNDVMRNIASRLTMEEIAAVAAYFATQRRK